jgi:hypothetical protein
MMQTHAATALGFGFGTNHFAQFELFGEFLVEEGEIVD